jgi:hypothetical protein
MAVAASAQGRAQRGLVIMAKTPSSRGPCLPLSAAQAARESTTVVLGRLSPFQNREVLSLMPLIRRDKLNGAVPMFMVIPVHKARYPASSLIQIRKGVGRIVRPIFEGLE